MLRETPWGGGSTGIPYGCGVDLGFLADNSTPLFAHLRNEVSTESGKTFTVYAPTCLIKDVLALG